MTENHAGGSPVPAVTNTIGAKHGLGRLTLPLNWASPVAVAGNGAVTRFTITAAPPAIEAEANGDVAEPSGNGSTKKPPPNTKAKSTGKPAATSRAGKPSGGGANRNQTSSQQAAARRKSNKRRKRR